MKKLIILLVLLVTFTGVVGAADFRDVEWGMTKAEVTGREGRRPDYEEEHMMAYETELFGAEFAVGYMFYNNKLTDARYMLLEDLPGTEYKNIIEDLDEALEEKYGENQAEGIVWLDDTYKNSMTDFDLAVSVGDVIGRFLYETDDIEVFMGIMGESYSDSFFVMYTPKDPEYKELIEQREEETKNESKSQL